METFVEKFNNSVLNGNFKDEELKKIIEEEKHF